MNKDETTSTSNKSSTAKSKNLPKYYLTTDLFKGKEVPTFITNSYFFKKPMCVSKIFPSIGLKNFKEPCDMSKPFIDLKKDNFVSNLIVALRNHLIIAHDRVQIAADKFQYLLSGENKVANLAKRSELYNLSLLIRSLLIQMDSYNNVWEQMVQTSDNKIAIKLFNEINDTSGKKVFGKNEGLFKVFNKLREMFLNHKLEFINLEQLPEYKIFHAENIPNKGFNVCFSAEGPDGAWDIATMSMRGITSCQRWEGEHHLCLIGSIISQFVGIIYITSGSDFEKRGTKMIRRSLVRYAIDADENKPCLIIDRIYPLKQEQEADNEALKIFVKALSSKTSLPIYLASQLGPRVKHLYVPYETYRNEISEKNWAYQDTPLKTSVDFQILKLLQSSNDEVKRNISLFKTKLISAMSEKCKDILNNPKENSQNEIYKILRNIKLNYSIDQFNVELCKNIFNRINFDISMSKEDPKIAYRKYLSFFLIQLKNIHKTEEHNIKYFVDGIVSRVIDYKVFNSFIFEELLPTIIKQEIKNSF